MRFLQGRVGRCPVRDAHVLAAVDFKHSLLTVLFHQSVYCGERGQHIFSVVRMRGKARKIPGSHCRSFGAFSFSHPVHEIKYYVAKRGPTRYRHYGIIIRVGETVIDTALAVLRSWHLMIHGSKIVVLHWATLVDNVDVIVGLAG